MTLALYDDHFTKPAEEYVREHDTLKYYVDDVATFLSINTKRPLEECRNFVTSNLKKDGAFPFKDPKVIFLDREENGDRVKKETTLHRYMNSSLKAREIIAPTFTTYTNPEVSRSLLSIYIEKNISKRAVAKKA